MRLTPVALPAAAVTIAAVTLGPAPGAATASPEPDHSDRAGRGGRCSQGRRLDAAVGQERVVAESAGRAAARAAAGTQAIWYQQDSTSAQSIRARLVLESGKVGSAIAPVVTGWTNVVDDPKIIAYAGQRMVVFGGTRSTSPGEKFNGPMAYATSSNGTSWTLGNWVAHTDRPGVGRYGTAARQRRAATPIGGVNAGSHVARDLPPRHRPSVPPRAPDWTTSLQPTDAAPTTWAGA